MTITKHQVDLEQGQTEAGEPFGYIAGDDGGFFFTWQPTLEATLASVEEDEIDGDGGLEQSEIVEFLRNYLPATKQGKARWKPTPVTCCVCGEDFPDDDDGVRLVATDHGPDYVCGGCTYESNDQS